MLSSESLHIFQVMCGLYLTEILLISTGINAFGFWSGRGTWSLSFSPPCTNPLIHQKWQTKRQKCKILQEKTTTLVTACQLSCKAEKSDQWAKALGNSAGDKSMSQQFQSRDQVDQQRGLCRGGFCGGCNRRLFSPFLLKRNCCTVVEVCIHATPAASNIICSPR